MKTTLNAHRVFHDAPDDQDYLEALALKPAEREALTACRDQVRETLREGFRNWQTHIRKDVLFEGRALLTGAQPPALKPKFRMQGSFAYHTLNRPARHPQEIDLDDGVFLPTSFVDAKGHASPMLASKGYFAAVETMLAPLCQKRNWRLITDKPTCVRVKIASNAHLDLPLYAIPDQDFKELVEKAAMEARALGAFDGQVDFADPVYTRLPEDRIMLAVRGSGWKPSDPRKLDDWFKDAIGDHGQQLRRVCRYFKGWRDHVWDKSPLSSIAIMWCVVDVYDGLGFRLEEARDDVAILTVAERLPDLLKKEIPNPVVPGMRLDEKWTATDRIEIVARAEALVRRLKSALTGPTRPADAVAHLISAFGERVPNEPALVIPDGEAAKVLSFHPAKVAAPAVPRTTSG